MACAGEPDLNNRDPNNLNDHLQVSFEEVIGEPDHTQSIGACWKCSYKCFNCWKWLCYVILSTIWGWYLAAWWGCYFAFVAFYHVWVFTPSIRAMEVNCKLVGKVYSLCIHACCDPCCEACGNIFNAFRKWLDPLFRRGFRKDLELSDLYATLPQDKSAPLKELLEKKWEEERLRSEKPSLARALYQCVRCEFNVFLLVLLIVEFSAILQPLAVGRIISFFLGYEGVTHFEAGMYAILLSCVTFLYPLPRTQVLMGVNLMAMRVRTACSALIFNKTLSMSNKAYGATSAGHIVTLLSADVEKFHMGLTFIHYIVVGPVQTVVILVLLYQDFGLATLAGLLIILVVIPLQMYFGKIQGTQRMKRAKFTDKRVMLMSEIIAGMQVIKMYCWEKPLQALIMKLRKKEMREVHYASHLKGQTQAAYFISGKMVAFVILVTYALLGYVVTAEKAFKMMGWIELIRQNFFLFFPISLHFGMEMMTSVKRIQDFLLLEDHAEDAVGDAKEDADVEEGAEKGTIHLDDVTASWTSAAHNGDKGKPNKKGKKEALLEEVEVFSLRDIKMDVAEGELHALVGPVGSGKSSLLMVLLGEFPPNEGVRNVSGRVAYAPQEAWVFAGTVRDNILFGQPMDEARYNDVIEACALVEDLASMDAGDLTMVGERGAKLSGGQKARINLARATYYDADIYLLDDPLSAVDTKIGRHLFEKCICGFLKDKTRVLVTHQLQFLKGVDRITLLEQGSVLANGTYDELDEQMDMRSMVDDRGDKPDKQGVIMVPGWRSETSLASFASMSDISIASVMEEEEDQPTPDEAIPPKQAPEEMSKGSVGFSVYRQFFAFGYGQFFVPVIVLLACGFQAAFLMSDWWLAFWSEQNAVYYGNMTTSGEKMESAPFLYRNIGIYGAFLGGMILLNVARSSLIYTCTLIAAQNLHDTMFRRLLRAPISFFQRNPVGRILNKFARDMGFIDDLIPFSFHDVSFFLVATVGTFVVSCVVCPYVIIITVPVIVFMGFLRYYAVKTTRSIKRIEAVSRGPLYSHMSASIQGLHAIRAFGMQKSMEEMFHSIQDRHTMSWSLFLVTYRWLGMRIEWSIATYLTLVVLTALLLPADAVDGGLLGLSLTQILAVSGVFQYTVRQSAELENLMTSVERILEYTKLEQEASEKTNVQPPDDWPTKGEIQLDHMSLTYHGNDSPALDDMCVQIKDTEKVGIVGRTGAGKSSMFVSLLRLSEPEGRIIIDGIDVTKIGLTDLREHISVIPQDPVLFSGSLRMNLDPQTEYTDDQIWLALDQVQLRDKVEELPGALYAELSESGGNFSVGQRQLVCLARALLRHNRILIIDEATANVDNSTDALIQETIREQFNQCTVLTIAHRLHTIMDCDKVLVLDHGVVSQFDHPYILLKNKNGIFHEMVKHTGKKQANILIKIASSSYEKQKREQNHHPGSHDNDVRDVHRDAADPDAMLDIPTDPADGGRNDAENETDTTAPLVEPSDEDRLLPDGSDPSVK